MLVLRRYIIQNGLIEAGLFQDGGNECSFVLHITINVITVFFCQLFFKLAVLLRDTWIGAKKIPQ